MEKIYLAYGSNMNLRQMEHRCPTAKVLGTSVLKDHRLTFRGGRNNGVANIEERMGDEVPVLLWSIKAKDERSLDRYEGYPNFYHKEERTVMLDGNPVKAMAYVMNDGFPLAEPSTYYFAVIVSGYRDNGIDPSSFEAAVKENIEECRCRK